MCCVCSDVLLAACVCQLCVCVVSEGVLVVLFLLCSVFVQKWCLLLFLLCFVVVQMVCLLLWFSVVFLRLPICFGLVLCFVLVQMCWLLLASCVLLFRCVACLCCCAVFCDCSDMLFAVCVCVLWLFKAC